MDSAKGSPPVGLDSEGRVAQDVPCRTCKYNLRGLSPEGRCPECGSAVGWSIHSDLLCYSNPVWVRHLAAGTLWIIISVLGGIVVTVFGGAVTGTIFQDRVELAQTFIGFSAFAVAFVGYWKLTMPDPGREEQRPIWNIRQMTRLLATVGFLSSVVVLILNLIPGFPGALPTALVRTVAISIGLFGLAGLVAPFLLFIHMRRLALRIPNDSLARQTRMLLRASIIFFATIIVGLLAYFGIFVVGTPSSELRFVMPAILFGCVMVLGLLVFGIWWIVLLFRYRSEFRQAARSAKETWAAVAPPDTTERPNQNGRP